MKYEDLHKYPIQEMKRICEFIGLELSDSRIKEIYENNSINNLRERVGKFGMDKDHTWKNKPITSFFRKGAIGNYKTELSSELIDSFNDEAMNELKLFGYVG